MEKQILARTENAEFFLKISESEFPHKQFSGSYSGHTLPDVSQITQVSDFRTIHNLCSDIPLKASTEEDLLTQFRQHVQASHGEILEFGPVLDGETL
jgi:hypothetical protein